MSTHVRSVFICLFDAVWRRFNPCGSLAPNGLIVISNIGMFRDVIDGYKTSSVSYSLFYITSKTNNDVCCKFSLLDLLQILFSHEKFVLYNIEN